MESVASEYEKNLSDNLKMRMALRNWAPKDLAAASGLSGSAIYAFLKQVNWPGPDNLRRLARALGCTPGQLLEPNKAQTVPDVDAAVKSILEFYESLTPVRRRLLNAATALDDAQVAHFSALMEEAARAASGEDDRQANKKADQAS